jgi:uncharacterized protein (DUF433 family)
MAAPIDIGTLIECTPGVVGGRPRIAGTRMPVDVIASYWKQGHSAEEIVATIFTDLGLAGVHAALAYYLANREAVDRRAMEDEINERIAAAESLRQGDGPPDLTAEERAKRAREHERTAALLRSALK